MSISIICSRCNTPYTLPATLAGKTVACKKCNALLDVPFPEGARVVMPSLAVGAGNSRYNRIVGKPPPLIFDIIGVHTRWEEEATTRDVLRLIWSFYHLALLIAVLVLWTLYADSTESALMAAPFFLAGAILFFLIGWLQIRSIGRSIAQAIRGNEGRRGPSFLSHVLSSVLVVISEPRAALPALRTAVLGFVTLLAAFSLACQGGSWTYILPITSLPSFSTPAPPRETMTPTPTPNATQASPAATQRTQPPPPPPPPPPDEKPLPPPEDTSPLPPP